MNKDIKIYLNPQRIEAVRLRQGTIKDCYTVEITMGSGEVSQYEYSTHDKAMAVYESFKDTLVGIEINAVK